MSLSGVSSVDKALPSAPDVPSPFSSPINADVSPRSHQTLVADLVSSHVLQASNAGIVSFTFNIRDATNGALAQFPGAISASILSGSIEASILPGTTGIVAAGFRKTQPTTITQAASAWSQFGSRGTQASLMLTTPYPTDAPFSLEAAGPNLLPDTPMAFVFGTHFDNGATAGLVVVSFRIEYRFSPVHRIMQDV
jgi:hypothetical protein